MPMPIPVSLRSMPFRGSAAVAAGLITAWQLCGSEFRRLYPDVYLWSAIVLDHRRWCEAAILYIDRPAAAISGLSAAYLMGVDLLSSDHREDVEVTVPPGIRIRTRGIATVRTRLRPVDIDRSSWVPVTSPERTAFDLARRLPRMDAVAAVDALLHRHFTTVAQVRDYLLASGSVRGRPQVAEVLALADAGAESPRESWLRVTLIDGGLPRPETQIDVFDAAGGLVGRVDVGYREQRVGVEYEGDHHRDRGAFQLDLARINTLQAAGWTIIRASAADLRNPRSLLDHVRAALDKSAATELLRGVPLIPFSGRSTSKIQKFGR